MTKIKVGFTGIKKDSSGEVYKFKNGIAVISGIKFERKPVLITIKDFNELNSKETQSQSLY